MATYYVDPSVPQSGNGLSPETAFKFLSQIPATSANTILLRADGLLHRPSDQIPTNVAGTNIARSKVGSNTAFSTYGSGDPTLTGAVVWNGPVGATQVNGVPCLVLATANEVDPLWFPRVDRAPAFPSICSTSGVDGVDTFLTDAFAVDNIANGANGYRFCPSEGYGGTLDATKEVSFSGAGPCTVKIRDLFGFWRRANAVRPLSTHDRVVMRTGANFTNYFGRISSFDHTDGDGVGAVYITSEDKPSNGESGEFFYALVGHPYGLRLQNQYASLPDGRGWIVALPNGSLIDVACYSTLFYLNGNDEVVFDPDKVWRFEAIAHGNTAGRSGYGICVGAGCDGFTIGAASGKQIRNYTREGGVIGAVDTGAATRVAIGHVVQTECLGAKAMNISMSGAAANDIRVSDSLTSTEGGGGLRFGGEGAAMSVSDIVVAPRACVHDNASNYYVGVVDTLIENAVIVGQVNPHAQQWNSTTTQSDTRRRIRNSWFSGRPRIDGGGWVTSAIMRHDNGNTNGLYDRVIAVGGRQNFFGDGQAKKPNTGLVIQRSVLDMVGRTSRTAFAGVTFRRVVFCGQNGDTTLESIVAEGGVVEDCVMLPQAFDGVITDQMWDVLTRTDDMSAHEPLDPWLAPQLHLSLPAYGAPRTIRRPVLVHAPIRTGHQAGVMYGTFLNPNPLSRMTLIDGVADNGLVQLGALGGGINLVPTVDCPSQPTYSILLRVTDEGATNGPSQDFLYTLEVGQNRPPASQLASILGVI